ncbi:MAG: thiamine pyrophosphate-dependent dehydrogenase E1 component subunit alpha [Syntrophorhabdus sp.]|nr:thiamine pyrophosphate-dependent dehydrogenase E1 component subunit alpha [Syntrophorhabdus sp.]
MTISPQTKKMLLHTMLRIRMVQEGIESRYLEDEMKTPVHLCVGQEAIAAGVCAALTREDYIASNHRGHGHYLAKGGDLKALVAELHGRVDGCSKGFGGSMHLIDTSVGHMGSSSIVGGCISIGTGLGLAIKMKGTDQVCAVFFGDGAADEGVLYESINFAVLKRLPVIFILENNGWSVCSSVSARQEGRNIFHYAPPDRLFTGLIDGNDALAVYEAATEAVERARKGLGPSFLECLTYRILPHAGCAAQDASGYRDQEEIDAWRSRCPVERLKTDLVEGGILSPEDVAGMEQEVAGEIEEAFVFAKNSPKPDSGDLEKNLFCE